MGKVHESCEKHERHLTKLGNSVNGTLPAVGYLRLSEKVQGEGLGEEREEKMKGMEKFSWRETEKTQAVYLMRRDKKRVEELKNIPRYSAVKPSTHLFIHEVKYCEIVLLEKLKLN